MCGVRRIERVSVAETRLGSPPSTAASSLINWSGTIPIVQHSTVDFADQSRIAQAIGNLGEFGTQVAEHSLPISIDTRESVTLKVVTSDTWVIRRLIGRNYRVVRGAQITWRHG